MARRHTAFGAVFTVGAMALLTAGCGANPIALLARNRPNPQAYAACMRAHGIADFPDAKNGGYQIQHDPTRTTVDGVTLKESQAQFDTADQACQHYLGTPTNAGPASPAEQQAALAYAQCMRSHGFPNFPDPHVTANSFMERLPPGTDPNSPQFQAANNACKALKPQLLG